MKKKSKRFKNLLKSVVKGNKLSPKEILELVKKNSNTKFDESTVLAVDYSSLKNINLVKPTLKRYLAGHVKTQFRRIDADEFTVATLLPVQRFRKSSDSAVWGDSRRML